MQTMVNTYAVSIQFALILIDFSLDLATSKVFSLSLVVIQYAPNC